MRSLYSRDHLVHLYHLAIGLCLALVLAVPALGAETAPEQLAAASEETIVVTASRLPQPIEEVPAAVEVITAEQIRAAAVSTVEDALALGANIVASSYGDTGALSTANLQGATSSQVQVQLNGRPLNPGTSSSVDLSLIPLGDIERIEIVKGPASALYGANAVGGVVNIITREPRGAGPETVVAVGMGAAGEKRISLTSEGGVGSAAYLLTTGAASADGIRINSHFADHSLTGRVDWEYRNGKIALNTRYASREAGSPGPNGRYGFAATPLAHRADKAWDVDLQYSTDDAAGLVARVYHSSNSIIYDDPNEAPPSETDSQVTGVETRKVIDLGTHRIVVGGEYRHDLADSTFYAAPQSADNLAVYLEDLIATGSAWSFTVGGRLDSDSRYGKVFSPRAAAVYGISTDARVWGAVGQAFRAPSFNELYWGGTRQLDPEIATSYQLGAAAGPFDLTLYHKNVVNYLKWNGADDVANVTSRFNGIEAAYRWQISGTVAADLAYAWVDAVKASDGSRLTDVPATQASVTIQAEMIKGWKVSTKLYHQSSQLTSDYSTSPSTVVSAPGFMTVDSAITRTVSQTLTWHIRLENAFDVRYEKVPGYPMPGRTLSVGARLSF